VPGLLGDQAHTARALLDAHEVTGDSTQLDRAVEMARLLLDRFGDRQGEGTVTGTGVALQAVGDSGAGMVWHAVTPAPFGRLWSCIRCMSVWTGLVVTVLAVYTPSVFWALCLPLAASEVAIRIHRVG